MDQPGEVPSQCPSDETLAAYLDGALTEEEREKIEEHLVDCTKCRRVVAEAVRRRLPS
jgi:anti-sigma factor RsiW